jgi:hypothetical protein
MTRRSGCARGGTAMQSRKHFEEGSSGPSIQFGLSCRPGKSKIKVRETDSGNPRISAMQAQAPKERKIVGHRVSRGSAGVRGSAPERGERTGRILLSPRSGASIIPAATHGLRRGLHSAALTGLPGPCHACITSQRSCLNRRQGTARRNDRHPAAGLRPQ